MSPNHTQSIPYRTTAVAILAALLSGSFSSAYGIEKDSSSAKYGDEKVGANSSKRPKDKLLNDVYTAFVSYKPNSTLRSSSRLVHTTARAGFKDPRARLRLSRALLWVGCAFQLDENLVAARSAFLAAHQLVPTDVTATCFLANCEREMHHYEADEALLTSLKKQLGMPSLPKPAKQEPLQEHSNDKNEITPPISTGPPDSISSSDAIFLYTALARNARRHNDFEVATSYLQAAEELDTKKTNALLQVLIAKTLVLQGLGQPAADRFERAAKLTENPYTREILLADAASLRLDAAAHEKYLIKASEIYSYDPIWKVKLSSLYAGSGRDAEALKQLNAAVNSPRLSSNAYISLAQSLSGEKKYDEAIKVLDRLQKLIEPSAAIKAAKADVYWAKKDSENALKFYDEALRLNDQFARPYEAAANIYLSLKKNDDALTMMRRCTTNLPKYWRGHLTYGSILLNTGHLDEAVDECKRGIALLPQPQSDLNVLAKHHAGRGHAIIGYSHYKNRLWKEALAEAKEFNRLKFNPDLPLHLKMVQIRPGPLMFTDELGLKDPFGRAALSDMLLEAGDLVASEKEYRKAVELLPDNGDLHAYLLHVLTQRGDWSEAAKENLVLSSKIVNGIPARIGNWGKKDESKKESN